MAYQSTAYRLRGIEPDDLAWHAAGERDRRGYWRKVVEIGLRVKRESLERGKDRHGFNLAKLTRYTRKHRRSAMGTADPAGAPLSPAHGLSRTQAYLKGRAHADHAEFYWTNGWGRILAFHRAGARNRWAKSGRLPVRDVIGLSRADERKVAREARAWWHAAHTPPPKPKARPPIPLPAPYQPLPTPTTPRPAPVPVAARPALVLPKFLQAPEASSGTPPRKRATLARRAGLLVRRTLDTLKGLFRRKSRGA